MDQPPNNQIEPAPSSESWFASLIDLRMLVFLVSIAVVAMTATVLMISGEDTPVGVDQPDSKLPTGTQLSNAPPSLDSPMDDGHLVASTPLAIDQSEQGIFELPAKLAVLSGAELESNSTGITNWKTDDFAKWVLAISERRKGFFYCNITYQAELESQFSVQLGQLKPRTFTIYPHAEDFTEQFIVRLDKPDEQALKLVAKRVETISGVRIKQIKLIPR